MPLSLVSITIEELVKNSSFSLFVSDRGIPEIPVQFRGVIYGKNNSNRWSLAKLLIEWVYYRLRDGKDLRFHLLLLSNNSGNTWHHSYSRKWRETKKPLDEGENGEWKNWLKAQHSENQDQGIQSHHSMVNRWRNNGNSDRLYFLGIQNHCRWWLQS